MKMEAKRVQVILEKSADGKYSCYADSEFDTFALAGYGDSAEEAKKDMLEAYQEIKEIEESEGRVMPEMTFEYCYDMQSFFNYFSYLNVSKIAEKAGMNPSLLRQYSKGLSNASEKQYDKLREAIKGVAKELEEATF